jgi:hypothetical protein
MVKTGNRIPGESIPCPAGDGIVRIPVKSKGSSLLERSEAS